MIDRVAEVFLAPVGAAFPARDRQLIERDGWYQTITPSSRSAIGNEVVYSRLDAASAERVVDETIAVYAAHGLPFKWCVGPLTEPADFGALLERRGFTSWPVRGMAIDPAAWPAWTPAPGVSVEHVTRANVDDYVDGFERGWETSYAGYRDDVVRSLDEPGYQMFVARVDGELAGTAGMIVKPRSGYLVGGNVLPAFRGRGLYRALLDERLRRLRTLGKALATTQAREATSAPILERLGFETVYRSRIYKWEP